MAPYTCPRIRRTPFAAIAAASARMSSGPVSGSPWPTIQTSPSITPSTGLRVVRARSGTVVDGESRSIRASDRSSFSFEAGGRATQSLCRYKA